jgi:hypothetical protein
LTASAFESFEDYQDFVNGRKMMTFIKFNNFKEVENPLKENEPKALGSIQVLVLKYIWTGKPSCD